jgi:AcrR family transcriptional regulator
MGGIPQEDIAAALGISLPTLHKHYRQELDHGMTEANARVVRTAFQQATSGESPAMTMFWLKTRMGWKETQKVEHAGEDGGPVRILYDAEVPDPDNEGA